MEMLFVLTLSFASSTPQVELFPRLACALGPCGCLHSHGVCELTGVFQSAASVSFKMYLVGSQQIHSEQLKLTCQMTWRRSPLC